MTLLGEPPGSIAPSAARSERLTHTQNPGCHVWNSEHSKHNRPLDTWKLETGFGGMTIFWGSGTGSALFLTWKLVHTNKHLTVLQSFGIFLPLPFERTWPTFGVAILTVKLHVAMVLLD